MPEPTADKFYTIAGVHVLALGDVTDMHGKKVSITDDFCQQLSDDYRKVTPFEALLTLDHESKGPAHGRIESLRAVPGYGLYADYADVPADAAKAFLHGGAYPNRSAEIIPINGKQYFGAVSHLGARRPALKNLAPILPHQITEQPAPSAQLGEYVAQPGVWLGSYEPEEEQEQTMTPEQDSGAAVALAEENGQLKSENTILLAENQRLKEQEAVRLAEMKFSEAHNTALKFAESDPNKKKLGTQTGLAAAIIAAADTNSTSVKLDGQEIKLGEAIRQLVTGLPESLPPAGLPKSNGAQTKAEDPDPAAPLEFKTGAEAKAYLAEEDPGALKLGERFASGPEKDQDAFFITLARKVQKEKEREA